MLTRAQKENLVKDLTGKLGTAKAVVFSDFRGLKVKDLTVLKKDLRKAEIEFKVLKKTLINLALKNSKLAVDVANMEGQIAVSISQADEVAPAKILSQFGKTNENLKILGGILDKKFLNIEEIKALAKLPGKDELLAKLVGTLNAPISGLVNVMAGNLRNLVQVLKAISEVKN